MSSNLTDLDNALISDMIFKFRGVEMLFGAIKGSVSIEFQFPPRIISDNRKGDWIEAPLRGDEPVAVYATSGAREITMTWTYIAGARGGASNSLFTPEKVASQVRALRSYFSSPYKEMRFEDALTVYFRMWHHTGFSRFTCRMKSVDVTHGKALVKDPRTVLRTRAYALRTDITAEMRLWTKVGASSMIVNKESAQDAAGEQQKKLELPRLESVVPPDWQ